MLKSIAVDLGPLRRYRDFRLRTFAQGISEFGTSITLITVPIQIKELTNSPVAVGLVAAAELMPIIFCGLIGGGLADRFDRRQVVLWCELASLMCIGVLLANALTPHPRLWVIYLVAAFSAAAGSLHRPSMDSMVPRQVAKADLAAASALESGIWVIAGILGPSLGGVLASASIPTAYTVNLVTFVLSMLLLLRIAPVPASGEMAVGLRGSIAGIGTGIRYAAGRKDLLGTYLIDSIAMVTAMPIVVFPFFAQTLHAGHAVGLLYAADSVGALLATVLSGWVARVRRHGVAIILAATGWGAAIGLAGLMPSLPLVLIFLVLAGGADMTSGLFRGTMWNQTIPDELRGRLAGIELLSYSVGPTVGSSRAGLMAARGVRFSIVGGGVLCVLGVTATAAALPALRSYDSRVAAGAE